MDRTKWASPEKLQELVFGFDIASKTLSVFDSKEQAIATVEGLSIAEGDWRFFSYDGSPLDAIFSVPAKINFDTNTYSNGLYTLEATQDAPSLLSVLSLVECEDKANSGLLTLRDVEQYLVDRSMESSARPARS